MTTFIIYIPGDYSKDLNLLFFCVILLKKGVVESQKLEYHFENFLLIYHFYTFWKWSWPRYKEDAKATTPRW